MKKTVFVILAVILAAVVAVAGCVSAETETQSPVGQWIFHGEYSATFNPDGTMTVIAGNTYKGTYTVTESGIVINDLTQITRMTVSEDEAAFIASLKSASAFTIENGDLILTANGTELTLKKAVFGTWKNEEGISINLATDMTFSATSGVNIIFGTYQYTENGIIFNMDAAASTMAMGSEEEMAAEQALKEALAAVTTYTCIENQLTLIDANGKALMTVTHVPTGIWIAGDVVLEVQDDGTVLINAGNTYAGTYTFSEHKIVVKDLYAKTKMAVSEEEQAFIEALETAGNTLSVNQFLTIYDKDGKVAVTFLFA